MNNSFHQIQKWSIYNLHDIFFPRYEIREIKPDMSRKYNFSKDIAYTTYMSPRYIYKAEKRPYVTM